MIGCTAVPSPTEARRTEDILQSGDYGVLLEALRNVDGWAEWMRLFIADFGRAIDAWPDLWQLAKGLGAEALLRN